MSKTYTIRAVCTNCEHPLEQWVKIPYGKHWINAEDKRGSGYGEWHYSQINLPNVPKGFWNREKFVECEQCGVAALELA